jgi:hypothetical protein
MFVMPLVICLGAGVLFDYSWTLGCLPLCLGLENYLTWFLGCLSLLLVDMLQ